MLQRAALAQALLGEPELLLLDEPTSGLDPESQWGVRECVRERSRRGTTVVVSSHNLVEVEMLCERVAVLHRGRLVVSAPVEELRDAGRPRSRGVWGARTCRMEAGAISDGYRAARRRPAGAPSRRRTDDRGRAC